MAIVPNGPGGQHIGRIGNIVYYPLGDVIVARTIGTYKDAPTDLQLKNRLATKLSGELIKRLMDFINTGFMAEAIQAGDNPYNQAIKCNKKQFITGTYPDLKIAYDKLQVSKGTLKPAQDWKVTQTEQGLQYTWATNPEMSWPEVTDQVMMLAYFPEQDVVLFTLFGNNRSSGEDLLEIPEALQGEYMETYISFIAANRKQVADSTYTGNFNCKDPQNTALIS